MFCSDCGCPTTTWQKCLSYSENSLALKCNIKTALAALIISQFPILLFQWLCHRKNNASQNAPTFTPRIWCTQFKSLPFGVNAKTSNWSLSSSLWWDTVAAVSMALAVDDIHGPIGCASKQVIYLEGTAQSQPLLEEGIGNFGKGFQLPLPFTKKRLGHIWTEVVSCLLPFHFVMSASSLTIYNKCPSPCK